MNQESAVAAPTGAPPISLRWTVLLVLSVAMFGNYYAYDSIAPLADQLQRALGFSDTQIGTLNAIYSLPNIVMVLIGGILVDRFGTRIAILLFAGLCTLGAVLTAVSSSFYVMAAGRLVFGLGSESLIVAVTTALGQWFVGRQLGFAFGLNLSLARAGSWAADLSPSWAGSLYASGWQPPLWLAAGLCALSLGGAFLYYALDRGAARRYRLTEPGANDRFVVSDLWRFDRSYWYVVGLCVTFYSVIFPFRSTFAIKYFQHAHGLSLEQAGALNGWVFFAAIFATPAFGLLVDGIGRRALLMTGGSLLLLCVFPVLDLTQWDLRISTVLIGIAFSLVPAVLWPSVPYLVEPKRLGTAYGLMTLLQNVGLTAFNLAAGALNDANQAGADNPAGYSPMLWMFATLSLAGLAFAWLLRRRERGPHGHDLERRRPRPKHHYAV
jgi:MFS family permease